MPKQWQLYVEHELKLWFLCLPTRVSIAWITWIFSFLSYLRVLFSGSMGLFVKIKLYAQRTTTVMIVLFTARLRIHVKPIRHVTMMVVCNAFPVGLTIHSVITAWYQLPLIRRVQSTAAWMVATVGIINVVVQAHTRVRVVKDRLIRAFMRLVKITVFA